MQQREGLGKRAKRSRRRRWLRSKKEREKGIEVSKMDWSVGEKKNQSQAVAGALPTVPNGYSYFRRIILILPTTCTVLGSFVIKLNGTAHGTLWSLNCPCLRCNLYFT